MLSGPRTYTRPIAYTAGYYDGATELYEYGWGEPVQTCVVLVHSS